MEKYRPGVSLLARRDTDLYPGHPGQELVQLLWWDDD